MNLSSAYFGGGCFWCLEAVFQRLKGVSSVISGYAGGKFKNPTYKEVCSGLSGHAEIVKIEYDMDVISFVDLLLVFFSTHDPTTLNRQGNDVGTQYRSVIYYINDEQKAWAEAFTRNEATQLWDDTIITVIEPLDVFYPAELNHQNYYNTNPNQGYCTFVIQPKVDKLNTKFQKLLKNEG